MDNIKDIRKEFRSLHRRELYTVDRSGQLLLEIIGASFLADEETIFGKVNQGYVNAEIEWYKSLSTNIRDIYPDGSPPPKAWQMTANGDWEINSNYGLLIYSPKFFNQYRMVIEELRKNPLSRRACMIYTRPSMWVEYNEGGKNDFICTNSVSYYVRDEKVNCVVQMRLN